MRQEVYNELTERIIPFWHKLKDEENGGFFGEVSFDYVVDKTATKACLINSRILWFFASAYTEIGCEQSLADAHHAYEFMLKHCIDTVHGGVYWSLNFDGTVFDATKHTYNQAFAVYALSAYYTATNNKKALELAMQIYDLIETKCRDKDGYLESFSVGFLPQSNEKLSENGVMAERTMNTLLHVYEGYTALYRASNDEKVKASLYEILDIFEYKMYNKEKKRQEVFFDKAYNSLIDLHSYGHDIETSWLIDEGLKALNDSELTERFLPIMTNLASEVYEKALDNGSIYNECSHGKNDKTRVWWVQAEAVVGFLNIYEKDKSKKQYLTVANDIWKFIDCYVIDKRDGGEWFWDLDDKLVASSKKNIAEDWKGPYHNGRMCFEILRRMQDDTQ